MIDAIQKIEIYCNKYRLDHRFVGGISFGGLLNKDTTWEINIKKREIKLYEYSNLSLYRSDKTKRDIDIILFEKDTNKILEFKKFLQSNAFDMTTVESAIYYPERINPIIQFVSAIKIDRLNQPNLVFGSIVEKISWTSLEPWKVIIKHYSYTVRNPIADFWAYQLRSPAGIKPKDIAKVTLLQRLTNDVIIAGKKSHIDYLSSDYFATWEEFVTKLKHTNDIQIILKKQFMEWYWKTIGERLAHGVGMSNKLYSAISNQFTGVRQ